MEILEFFTIIIDFLEILDNNINRRGDVAFTAKGIAYEKKYNLFV